MRITFAIFFIFITRFGISQPCGPIMITVNTIHITGQDSVLVFFNDRCYDYCGSSITYQYQRYWFFHKDTNNSISNAYLEYFNINRSSKTIILSPDSFILRTYELIKDTILLYGYHKNDPNKIYYKVLTIERKPFPYLSYNGSTISNYHIIETTFSNEDYIIDTILYYRNKEFKENWKKQFINNFEWDNDSTLSNHNQLFILKKKYIDTSFYNATSLKLSNKVYNWDDTIRNDTIEITLVDKGNTLWSKKFICKYEIPVKNCSYENTNCAIKELKNKGIIISRFENDYYVLTHRLEMNCPNYGIDIIPYLYKININGEIEYCRRL
jgi:hypothetical protein